MKMHKNIVFILLISLLLFMGCNKSKDEVSEKQIIRIGILQNKPQQWADALKLGFIDGLIEEGFEIGEDIILIPRSATGDPLALSTIAESFVRNKKINIIYTLGTQSSQGALNLTKEKPLIFGAVTDPVKAGLFKDNLTFPIGNITGTQDLWPYPAQFNLIKELLPNIKTIGTIFNSGEINSQVSISYIEQECKKHNINLKKRSISSDQELEIALRSLISQGIELFFIPADNSAQGASSTIISICNQKNIPVFTGISGIVEGGAIATVGTNYYQLGKVNAIQAVKMINNGFNARAVAVSIADKGNLYLNLKALKRFSISPSDNLKDRAFKIYN